MPSPEFDTIIAPPQLTEADREFERQCLEALELIYREARERAKPFQDMLARMYMSYPTVFMVFPRDNKEPD